MKKIALFLMLSCARTEAPPPEQAGATPLAVPPAASAPIDAGDPIWVRFGRPLPADFVTCAQNADCELAMSIPMACWPMAVNRAHRAEVEAQLHERAERGETCAHPGCGIEFHEVRCKRRTCVLLDGCQDPGGSH